MWWLAMVAIATLFLALAPAAEAADPFRSGWSLNDSASDLQVISVKNGIIAEANVFATLTGFISERGEARLRVFLDSIDTKIDLRNVRMRFLFFETFLHPEAIITARLDPAMLNGLTERQRITLPLDFVLSLHGIRSERSADVEVTLVSNDRVVVSSLAPIPIRVQDFGLDEGLAKLEEAAGVKIVPVGIVSFNLVFDRLEAVGEDPAAPVAEAPSTAIEAPGTLDREACIARLETYSATGRVAFKPASADLAEDSFTVLDGLFDVIDRCPDLRIVIAGHTGADGNARWNRTLSRKRAEAVKEYLVDKGAPAHRLSALGYGESRPLVPNNSAENKARNSRIEFSVAN